MNPTIIFLLYSLYLTNNDDDNKFLCQGIVMVIKQCVKACTFYFEVNAWSSDLKFYDDTQQKISYCLNFLSAYLNLLTNFLTNALSKIQKLENKDFMAHVRYVAFISNLVSCSKKCTVYQMSQR